MSEPKAYLALFADIDPAVDAIDRLREEGIKDEEMTVISGVPFTEHILGRPRPWSNVPRLAMGGAAGGFLFGVILVGLPYLYPLKIGGQALVSLAPSMVLLFEMTMLGLMASTFLGVFLDSAFPSYRPKEYVPEISDGKIAILYSPPEGKEDEVQNLMSSMGAESVVPAERRSL